MIIQDRHCQLFSAHTTWRTGRDLAKLKRAHQFGMEEVLKRITGLKVDRVLPKQLLPKWK